MKPIVLMCVFELLATLTIHGAAHSKGSLVRGVYDTGKGSVTIVEKERGPKVSRIALTYKGSLAVMDSVIHLVEVCHQIATQRQSRRFILLDYRVTDDTIEYHVGFTRKLWVNVQREFGSQYPLRDREGRRREWFSVTKVGKTLKLRERLFSE